MRNAYYILRHGESLAIRAQILVSTPEQGVGGYGLTEEGKKQVKRSAENAKKEGILDSSTIFISSDFTRARETAEIAAQVLGAAPPQMTPALRERQFGHFDGKDISNLEKVWEIDAKKGSHAGTGIESTEDVRARVLGCIEELEERYEGKTIVLVSHGDTLQIALTAFADMEPHLHRSVSHLNTAELRKLS